MPGFAGAARVQITCPACGRELWDKLLELEVGVEARKCKCGSLVATGQREWIHLTADERRSFWGVRRTISIVLTVFFTTSVVFGSWGKYTVGRAGLGFDWNLGLLVAGVLFAFDLTAKFATVRGSLKRSSTISRTDAPFRH